MSNSKSNHELVVLKIPESIASLIALARAIVAAMGINKVLFTSPSPALVQVTTDTEALVTAETATKARTMGAVAIRDEKRVALIADLHQLLAYVQQVVNQNPTEAASIAASAGMTLRKKATSRHKSDLAAKAHTVSGSVLLVAKALKGSRSNEWQYSTDGKTWTNAPPSTSAKIVLTNLQTGVLTYFRHRPVTKAGAGEWSQSVSMLVA